MKSQNKVRTFVNLWDAEAVRWELSSKSSFILASITVAIQCSKLWLIVCHAGIAGCIG
jgi:hypothetical protein